MLLIEIWITVLMRWSALNMQHACSQPELECTLGDVYHQTPVRHVQQKGACLVDSAVDPSQAEPAAAPTLHLPRLRAPRPPAAPVTGHASLGILTGIPGHETWH